MKQRGLFDPAPGLTSVDAKATSRAAAKSIAEQTGTLRARIYEFIKGRGARGATCDECEQELSLSHQTTGPRIRELVQAQALTTTGETRPTRSGRAAAIYIASLLLLIAAVQAPGATLLRVTAYCDRGRTACGRMAGPGQCAAPEWVPFGSTVVVNGRAYIVTDRTAKRFRRNTVDLWMPTRSACIAFGVHRAAVQIHPKGKHDEHRRPHRR